MIASPTMSWEKSASVAVVSVIGVIPTSASTRSPTALRHDRAVAAPIATSVATPAVISQPAAGANAAASLTSRAGRASSTAGDGGVLRDGEQRGREGGDELQQRPAARGLQRPVAVGADRA
ncbi:hypothetical protein ACFQV8_01725 [Pseudonocardia benzenivorans]